MKELLAVNLTVVLDRVDGDRELLLELIEIFLETMPTLIQRLQVAVEAGYDLPQTLRLIHELKGTAANLGAEELSRQARLYELSVQQGSKPQAQVHLTLLQGEYVKVSEELNQYRQLGGL